ncbi:MAG: hypothetical protein ACK445_08375 [Bacteroidota bacterium]
MRIIFMLILMLLLSSCNRQYWYRIKFPFTGSSELKTIKFEIVNYSPMLLSRNYEEEMKQYCLKRLAKQGLLEARTNKYDYDFVLSIDVDSFESGQRVWLGPFGDGMPNQTHIMQLSISYDLFFCRSKVNRWSSKSAIYFFANEKRDIRRSKSMAAYAIKTID